MRSAPKMIQCQNLQMVSETKDNSLGISLRTSNPLVSALAPILSRVRTDVFWLAKRSRSPQCIKTPLSNSSLLNHVRGVSRCGVAPIFPGTSVTKVGLLDFDSHKGETSWEDMKVAVLKVIKKLQNLGAAPIPFKSSGGQGVHLYILWDAPQDAYSVRKFLQSALKSAGLAEGTKGVAQNEVEIFPKQNSVADGKFGNMFILPLAGQSTPLDAVSLEDLGKNNTHKINWIPSIDVPIIVPPAHPIKKIVSGGRSLQKLRSALDAIPYQGADQFGYQQFIKFVFAVHYESGGSAEGLEIVHSFFSRAAEYDANEIDKLWANISAKGNLQDIQPITAATIYKEAYRHGWVETIANDFKDLTKIQELNPALLSSSFVRSKAGEIQLSMDNLVKAIGDRDHCGMDVGYDTFRDEIMYSIDGGINWSPFKDADYTKLRINLERIGFKSPDKEKTRDAVQYVAQTGQFDSAQLWLNSLEWDGVKRVDSFIPTYMATEDTPYHRAVGRYLWTALAGRILRPGCKADMAPVLVGKQGTRKSSAVASLSPDPIFFAEISFDEKDDDLSRKMRGCLIAEIAELKGLRTKDMEHVKAWITKQHENWIPKYREFSTIFPRRLVFIGTTNNIEFLADDTGNRRWLPVRVNNVINVDQITKDCKQLWAEAREMFKENGVEYKDAELLAKQFHTDHMMTDPWEPIIADWLDKQRSLASKETSEQEYLQTHEVFQGAISMETKNCGRLEQMRIGGILRKFGYERKKKRIGGRPLQVYVPTVPSKDSKDNSGGNMERT